MSAEGGALTDAERAICACVDPGWTHPPELHDWLAARTSAAVEQAAAWERARNRLAWDLNVLRAAVRALADRADSVAHLDGDSYGAVVSTDDLRAVLDAAPPPQEKP